MTNLFDRLKLHDFILTEYNMYKHGTKSYTFETDSDDKIYVEVSTTGLITIITRGEITIEAMREIVAIDWEAIYYELW